MVAAVVAGWGRQWGWRRCGGGGIGCGIVAAAKGAGTAVIVVVPDLKSA